MIRRYKQQSSQRVQRFHVLFVHIDGNCAGICSSGVVDGIMLQSLNEYIDAPSLRHTAVQFKYDSLDDKMQSSMTRAVMCLLHTVYLNFVGIV